MNPTQAGSGKDEQSREIKSEATDLAEHFGVPLSPLPFDVSLIPTDAQIRALQDQIDAIEGSRDMQFELGPSGPVDGPGIADEEQGEP